MTPLKLVFKNQFGEETIGTALNAPGAGGPGIFGGEGAPTEEAPINTIYLRTDATDLDDWFYRNVDGADTWVAANLSGTAADVLGQVLTGFTAAPGTVAAADTVLEGFEKLTGNTQNLPVVDNVLTGLAAGSNTPIAETDTILEALANLQAQIDAL